MYNLQTHIGFTNLWSNKPRFCVISSQRVKNGTRTPCNSEHLGGYYLEYRFWGFFGQLKIHFCLMGNIVPEPRADSNSKARVHPNLKNPRLRPLQVNIKMN